MQVNVQAGRFLMIARSVVILRAAYLAIKKKKITAEVLKDKLLLKGLTAVQVAQVFDIIFALCGATKNNWVLCLFQVYSRLFILFGSLKLNPRVFYWIISSLKELVHYCYPGV